MSLADLQDLAAELHNHKESMREDGTIPPKEFSLLANTLLQAVHEMTNIEERLRALETR